MSRQNLRPDLGPNGLKGLSAYDNVMLKFKSKLKYIGSTSTCHNLSKQFGPLTGPDRILGQIWVQIVWKGYQQMTMSSKSLTQS